MLCFTLPPSFCIQFAPEPSLSAAIVLPTPVTPTFSLPTLFCFTTFRLPPTNFLLNGLEFFFFRVKHSLSSRHLVEKSSVFFTKRVLEKKSPPWSPRRNFLPVFYTGAPRDSAPFLPF